MRMVEQVIKVLMAGQVIKVNDGGAGVTKKIKC